MSMILQVARLPADEIARVRSEPARLASILAYYSDAPLDDRVLLVVNFFRVGAWAKVLRIDLDDPACWVARALGTGMGEQLAFEMGYGPAWLLTPDEVADIATGLLAEPWVASLERLESEHEDTTLTQLIAFFGAAASEHQGIVAGVS
jgi:hypothetical protein